MSKLEALGADVEDALERISVPSYMIDAHGVIRWTNSAARREVGECVGRQFTSMVAPEDVLRAREAFAGKIVGTIKVTDAEVCLLDESGERVDAELSSVALVRGGHVIGVFGQFRRDLVSTPPPHPALTPRQAEILRLLEHGRSTRQIAEELHLSLETVRNHIRHLMRALGVHSRLEAVALARHELIAS